jgi:hypothetical protein
LCRERALRCLCPRVTGGRDRQYETGQNLQISHDNSRCAEL